MENNDSLNQKYSNYDKMKLIELIRSDIKCWENDLFLTKLGFYSAFFYRLSRYLSLHNFIILGSIFQFISHLITGCEISHRANIGPGLVILHPTGVLIGPYVRIGRNCMFCQGSGVFSSGEIGKSEPAIGDNLWAGSGCKIMGDIIIGDKVWIGPNTVVTKDVESGKVIFGIPGRVMPNDFISIR